MKLTNKLSKIFERIDEAKTVALFGHINYDYDCLGSLYAFHHFLKRIGKKVEVFLDGEINEIDSRFFDPKLLSLEPKEYDLLISLDCAEGGRMGKYSDYFTSRSNTVRIDHHKGLNYDTAIEVTYDYSSCCEVLMEIMELYGKRPDKIEAEFLYAGLIGDTNSFSNSNVTIQTFKHAINLVECGADIVDVTDKTLRTMSLGSKKLEGIMYQKMEMIDKDVCFCMLTARDFKASGTKSTESPSFANKLVDIDGINIACLIKQRENGTFTVSLRSRAGLNLLAIAKAIGGGGHPQACGAVLQGTEKAVKEKVIDAIRKNR